MIRLPAHGKWTTFHSHSVLPSDSVQSLLEGQSSAFRGLWVGTSKGLAHQEDEKWSILDGPFGISRQRITALLETISIEGHSALWIGTDAGLLVLEKGVWSLFDEKSGLPSNRVRCLRETKEANGQSVIWVGTFGGLARHENGSWPD